MPGPSYPTTWTELCNAALNRLQVGEITDFDTDTTNLGDACRQHLPLLIEDVLTGYDWNGLSKRAELVENETPPEFGYDHAYDLPSDFMRFCGEDEPDVDPYVVESGQLLTDAGEVYIRYVYLPTALSGFPHYLIPALVAGLAARMARGLTSSDALQKAVSNEYEQPIIGALARAKQADARLNRAVPPNQEDHVWHDELR